MDEAEVERLILTHYEGEAQALSSGAESNLLKFKEMLELLNAEEKLRWEEIKATYCKQQSLRLGFGQGEDMARQIGRAADRLTGIEEALKGKK